MINRQNLIQSKEYWITKIQISIFNEIENYIQTKGITKAEFAKEIGVSKGYVSQVLNGNFDHKLSKLVELSLAIGKVPNMSFEDLRKYQLDDAIAEEHHIDNNVLVDLETIGVRTVSSSGISYLIKLEGTSMWSFEVDKFHNEKEVKLIPDSGLNLETNVNSALIKQ